MADSIPARKLIMGIFGGGEGAFASIGLGAVRYIWVHAAPPRTPTYPAGQGGLHGMNVIQSLMGSIQSAERCMTLGAE